MWRKLILIFLLAGGFAILLFIKPWRTEKIERARIIDRLPIANIIGQSNLLELSEDLSKTLYYYDVSFRDILSPNIILSRSKKYGVDTQSPVYFFGNDSLSGNDWGILFSVSDESKINLGILRMSKSITIKDTLINDQHYDYSPEFDLYFAHEEDWFLIYKGEQFLSTLNRITTAKPRSIHPRWRLFLNTVDFKLDHLVAEIRLPKLKKYGIKSGFIQLKNDSSHFIVQTSVIHFDTLAFQLKEGGKGFPMRVYTRQLINLNLDFRSLKSHPNHPYHHFIDSIASKIGFPVESFWENFDGNIAFRRGGIEYIREKYIVSELDDDFNVREVSKSRKVKISNFSLFLNTNKSPEILFNKVKSKGIISADGNKHRFIFSPPFNHRLSDSSMIFYTSHYEPVVNPLLNNQVMWTINYTPVQFYIDSTTTKVIFGRIKFPLKKLINDYLK